MKSSQLIARKKWKKGFKKTNHFVERQIERNVSDQVIRYCLDLKQFPKKKTTIIISRKVLKKIGIKTNQELFVIIRNRVLITTFYRDISEFILCATRKYDCHLIAIEDIKKDSIIQ